LLLLQNDLSLAHSKKEAELKARIQELEAELEAANAIGRDFGAKFAALQEQQAGTVSQLDEARESNASLREHLPRLQAQLEHAQRELEQQSR